MTVGISFQIGTLLSNPSVYIISEVAIFPSHKIKQISKLSEIAVDRIWETVYPYTAKRQSSVLIQ